LNSPGDNLSDLASHLVEGKVTVFDFYAAWCQPCHKVNDHLYARLARGDTFAIRKIDIGSWESDVAEHFLENVPELPFLVFYDARGKRIAEVSGAKFEAIDDALLRSSTK
jgi:thiol:disulfide interchange protein